MPGRGKGLSRRLYRGIDRPYRSDEVRSRQEETKGGTDFTDCPFTALSHARGRKGEVLVLDLPDAARLRVTEELWLNGPARRFMLWGAFDRWLTAAIPAKDLRAEVRREGIVRLPPEDKGEILKQAIERWLAERSLAADASPSPRETSPDGQPVAHQDPEGQALERWCLTCGGRLEPGGTVTVTGRGGLCFGCYNAELAAESGVSFDNTRLEPVSVPDPKGVQHTFHIRSRLVPGLGHVMEAVEEKPEGRGYGFAVFGPEECDALALFRELYSRIRSGLEVQYLKETRHGLGFVDSLELSGRIDVDTDRGEPILVVDGRPRYWADLGRLLLTCEGWNVHIEIRSAIEGASLSPGAGKPSGLNH